MLSAGEEDLGSRHISEVGAAELEDDAGHLGRRAHAAHGNARDEGFVFGADHGGFDFTRRHRVDADTERRELAGHFAGQAREGGLRG